MLKEGDLSEGRVFHRKEAVVGAGGGVDGWQARASLRRMSRPLMGSALWEKRWSHYYAPIRVELDDLALHIQSRK